MAPEDPVVQAATEVMEDPEALAAPVAQEATVDLAETVDAIATGRLAEVATEETEEVGVMEAKEVLQIEALCHQMQARLQLGVQSFQVEPRAKALRLRQAHL